MKVGDKVNVLDDGKRRRCEIGVVKAVIDDKNVVVETKLWGVQGVSRMYLFSWDKGTMCFCVQISDYKDEQGVLVDLHYPEWHCLERK